MFHPPAKTVSGYWTMPARAPRSPLAHARCRFARNLSRLESGDAASSATSASTPLIRKSSNPRRITSRPWHEVYVDSHIHFDRHAVQQCLAEAPLTDRGDRGGVEVGMLRG